MTTFSLKVQSSKDISRLDYLMHKGKTPETVAYIAHEFAQNAVDAKEKAKLTVNGESVVYEVETDCPEHIVRAIQIAQEKERNKQYAPKNGRGMGLVTIAHNASLQVTTVKKTVRVEARLRSASRDPQPNAGQFESGFSYG